MPSIISGGLCLFIMPSELHYLEKSRGIFNFRQQILSTVPLICYSSGKHQRTIDRLLRKLALKAKQQHLHDMNVQSRIQH